jgi:3-methyladenine DNA glycosylase AlkD
MKNTYHQQLLQEIKKISPVSDRLGFGLKYVGTDKPSYHLNTAQHKKILSNFLKSVSLSPQEFSNLITSLYTTGQSYDEIILAGRLAGIQKYHPLDPDLLNTWLNFVHGWAETDTLCQMAFTDRDLLTNWPAWQKILKQFVTDKNVHKRRASVVLLTKPLRISPDKKLLELAIINVDKLKTETDILITKAVSWVLRSSIKFHQNEVAKYLADNQTVLPKIAIREVSSKLLTGKKYVNQKKLK